MLVFPVRKPTYMQSHWILSEANLDQKFLARFRSRLNASIAALMHD